MDEAESPLQKRLLKKTLTGNSTVLHIFVEKVYINFRKRGQNLDEVYIIDHDIAVDQHFDSVEPAICLT